MRPETATLIADEGDAGARRDKQQPQQKAGGTMKFAYKTGARPLDGYRINRGVGTGGFGEVYLAVSDAGKEVALKRIQRNLEIEVRGVSQCLNLKHPNLVALHDLKYDDEGQAWVVMEYVAGDSLKDVIDRNPNGMPQDEAVRWFREIGAGVAYLHGQGIVHRDLKPANIFDDEGVVKIGDYGLSKLISASRRSGQTESVGTFHYMAPEIGRGVYGKGIDIYALGIMLFEMLTGRVPFEGETSQEIIMKHLTDDPDTTGIPAPFRAVVQRALRKDPDKRFGSVQQMLDALNGALSGDGAPAVILDSPRSGQSEPIYIGDDTPLPPAEMVFGPLREQEVVVAEAVPTVRRPSRAAAGQGRPAVPVARPAARAVQATRTSQFKPTLSKTVIAVLLVLLVIAVPGVLPLLLVLALGYAGYWLCRALFWRHPAASAAGAARVDRNDPLWRKEMRLALGNRLVSERVAELTGSMLFAAVAATVLILIALLLHGSVLDGSVSGWAIFAWLTVTSILGSWIVLMLGKFWEGDDGDHYVRRFVMLLAGLAVGLVAFASAELLMVSPLNQDHLTARVFSDRQLPEWLFSADGQPLVAAYLLYFGGLFAILRWWMQSDPLRSVRLGWMAAATCVLWAWILSMFLPFPQPWGYILAVTISVATQLAAPWINEKKGLGPVLAAERKP
jgi:hypothetical protein